jgi:hypothetical protein
MLLLMCSLWPLLAFADWPQLPLPQHAHAESIGERVVLNGVPMQMHRIVSQQNPKHLQQFYQRHLGPNHTVTMMNGGVLLAQGRGQHFITIRITPLGNGISETLTTVSDVAAAKANHGRPLGINLPAQSKLLSDMESFDQGKTARQLVYQNQHSTESNINYLVDVLKQRGYQLQQPTSAYGANHNMRLFAGNKREARLVVMPLEQGSNVVLTMEQSQE